MLSVYKSRAKRHQKEKEIYMKITKQDVEYVAELSRLNFTDKEKSEMASHLENILAHFTMLDSVDTSNVVSTAHILSEVNVLRDDVSTEPFDRLKLLKNAPESDGECYIVPKVLE